MTSFFVKNEIVWLKKNFPSPKPVRVHFVNYTKSFGTCWDYDEYFLIKIAKRLDHDTMTDTLYHEWSHMLTFDTHPEHSHSWACAYGRIIRKSHNEDD